MELFQTLHNRMSVADERLSHEFRLHLLNCVFIYLCLILFSSQGYSLKSDNFECKLSDKCQCLFENEEGIDLSLLSENINGLNVTSNNLTFYFHPCSDVSIGNASETNKCYSGASICVFNQTDSTYTNLGLSNEVAVSSHGIRGPITFTYSHNGSITDIHLHCTPGSDYLEVIPSGEAQHYELQLNSPLACSKKVFVRDDPPAEPSDNLSTGSVLVIIFVVFVSVYFVGGALALKFLRGAEGREMIPNYDFWVSLPGLVKEGFLFTVNGCRPVQAYDRI